MEKKRDRYTEGIEGIEGIEGFMDHSAPDFVGGGANCPRYGEDLATAVDLELKLTPWPELFSHRSILCQGGILPIWLLSVLVVVR